MSNLSSHSYTVLPPFTRMLVIIAVMGATLIQVLDITIVNVALPHMQGSFGTTPDLITWVLTSYLVAAAIFMPLTGYFTDRLGQKKYLLISISGFVVASALCGAAGSLTSMVIFRLLQGVFGAALVPLSQSIMVSIFPEKDRGSAMAIWGIGVMVGPILGPTLGGYLTELASWRWNFYINVPIGIICFLLSAEVVPDSLTKERKMDWLGLLLISTAIGSFQYFLDRGNQADWFHASDICVAAFLFLTCLPGFLLHNLTTRESRVFDLRIMLDRNFAICSTLLFCFGLAQFGSMVILPLMTEGLLGYPVILTGWVLAPRGIAAMLSMSITGWLIRFVDPRWIILLGIMITCAGTYICTFYNLAMSSDWIILPMMIQGFGLGMVFVPLSAVAFMTLAPSMRAEAAGLFSLLRTLGGSAGISIVSVLLTRYGQIAWNQLSQYVDPFNPAVARYLAPFSLGPSSPMGEAYLLKLIHQQSQMNAYVGIFSFITLSFFLMMPLVFLLKKAKQTNLEDQIVHIE